MAIDINWYVKDKVVLAKISGPTTSDDLVKGNEVISKFMDETPAEKIHLIFDTTEMTKISISVAQSVHTLSYLRHQKMGSFLVFGMTGALKAVTNMMGRLITSLTRNDFHSFRDMDGCLAYLRKIDPIYSAMEEDATASVSE